MGPWNLSAPVPQLYPGYAVTAEILKTKNIPPDFESDGDLRYTHRHDNGAEIYFLGNRTTERVTAACRFRVSGCQPELWDPVTGARRVLPEFREEGGRTTVPLQFAPNQSYFVIFGKRGETQAPVPQSAQDRSSRAVNFPTTTAVAELTGPWEVDFDAKWGGPGRMTFQKLEDWTRRPEPGIRYYSGKAVYRKLFDAPPSALHASMLFLDLGQLAVMARVKVNQRDLGVVWCAPQRVAVPVELLKPAGNQLEITVANLWPNRLIRDAGLPAGERLTWSTWNPYKPTDALFPSGLLGPVRLETARSAR
jgi:hypothetical protein